MTGMINYGWIWQGLLSLICTTLFLSGCCSMKTASDGPIAPTKKISLWNGRDFSGWTFHLADANTSSKEVWSVSDDVIRCEGKPFGYMRTRDEYRDYKLHVEWRWPEKPSNSGIFLNVSGPDKIWAKLIECQLRAGDAGDFIALGGSDFKERVDKSKIVVAKKAVSSEKPAGQWNLAEIVCRGDTITVFINGVMQNQATGVNPPFGSIALQSEGGPVEFRNVYVEPLPK